MTGVQTCALPISIVDSEFTIDLAMSLRMLLCFSVVVSVIPLLVEAGTGVGKSLGYLLPAVKFALDFDRKAVISTHTINLQE